MIKSTVNVSLPKHGYILKYSMGTLLCDYDSYKKKLFLLKHCLLKLSLLKGL